MPATEPATGSATKSHEIAPGQKPQRTQRAQRELFLFATENTEVTEKAHFFENRAVRFNLGGL
jgi:hypothetical protein